MVPLLINSIVALALVSFGIIQIVRSNEDKRKKKNGYFITFCGLAMAVFSGIGISLIVAENNRYTIGDFIADQRMETFSIKDGKRIPSGIIDEFLDKSEFVDLDWYYLAEEEIYIHKVDMDYFFAKKKSD